MFLIFLGVQSVVFFKSLLENLRKKSGDLLKNFFQVILKLFSQTCIYWYFFQKVLRYAVLVFNS